MQTNKKKSNIGVELQSYLMAMPMKYRIAITIKAHPPWA
jgi:hypothetical protein